MRLVAITVLLVLGGCSRNPSVLLDHAGPHAAWTGWLFWVFFVVTAVVWTVVLAMLGLALTRGHSRSRLGLPPEMTPASDRRLGAWVATGVALSVLILTGLVGASYAVDRELIGLDRNTSRSIEITARQWWWEIRYLDGDPNNQFTTANELHVAVGERVKLSLKSNDVIHSLWLPNIAGKRDIIPGQENSLVIRVDRAGTWNGRCSEFCGYQHAFMGLTLIAQPPDEFQAWLATQRQPAPEPAGEEEKRGMQVFLTGPCAMCHNIRGSGTGYSSYAPDLTHLKSRSSIAAGAAPNTKGHLGGWIIDPHGLKPGVHMPVNLQNAGDFQALLAYLESLR
ncbi:cytochrome c oxidase subunit 2 [Rhodospirillales bacterium URHD0017]|nr:cytochrome c oxidase subunit 2 [Rhodospirillales bacterium URHD0017]